jgi:hypothetical protein
MPFLTKFPQPNLIPIEFSELKEEILKLMDISRKISKAALISLKVCGRKLLLCQEMLAKKRLITPLKELKI